MRLPARIAALRLGFRVGRRLTTSLGDDDATSVISTLNCAPASAACTVARAGGAAGKYLR